jgi:hypothetical protein
MSGRVLSTKKTGTLEKNFPKVPAGAFAFQQLASDLLEAVKEKLPGSVFRGAGANAVAAAQPNQELAFGF